VEQNGGQGGREPTHTRRLKTATGVGQAHRGDEGGDDEGGRASMVRWSPRTSDRGGGNGATREGRRRSTHTHGRAGDNGGAGAVWSTHTSGRAGDDGGGGASLVNTYKWQSRRRPSGRANSKSPHTQYDRVKNDRAREDQGRNKVAASLFCLRSTCAPLLLHEARQLPSILSSFTHTHTHTHTHPH